jgi:hypothetical protein
MLKCYCYSCGGWGVPCHTMSPQRMIPPPIKRSRILVSGGVLIVISVKLYVIVGAITCMVTWRSTFFVYQLWFEGFPLLPPYVSWIPTPDISWIHHLSDPNSNEICGCDACGCAYLPGNSRIPTSSDQSKKCPVRSQQSPPSSTSGFPLPKSPLLKLFCALPTKSRTTNFFGF